MFPKLIPGDLSAGLGRDLGFSLGATPRQGVPQYLTINGVLAILLFGADGQPLQGADGQYLYGVAP